MKMKIDVLGTKYTIRRVNYGQDGFMEKMHYGGYCDGLNKEIVVLNCKTVPDYSKDPEDRIKELERRTMRHELIHAFLNESGLEWNSCSTDAWAKNEEMVDWFAIMMPKLLKAFKAADCL